MFEVREDEPGYAFIPQADAPELNRYGKPIQLVSENDPLVGKSLNINDDPGIGAGANRYKQHGFFFKADHCIGCHACEAACSEKNDLPPHISFRSVGYVEGGSYPAYQRLNISMACNHCDDPVCLKGCPTRAYTKYAEYGAVLQDPDICFGCGYCTWVCPYNAPQLDPIEGQVSKCNMCVDRLEVGLKPACVSACLAGALDFGIIETTPVNRKQLESVIPGFPAPDITHPNIRFEQTRSLPREMRRTDSIPLRYERDERGQSNYKSKVSKDKQTREWNLGKLRSREDPLVIFTLVSQAVVGAFMVLFLVPLPGINVLSESVLSGSSTFLLFTLIGMQTFALALSTAHLGKPRHFYRAMNNLRYSPVSREVAVIAIFYTLLFGYTLTGAVPGLLGWLFPEALVSGLATLGGWGAVIAGPLAIYSMHAIYRIKARPFWNHWHVLTSFYGNTLSLGTLLVGLVFASTLVFHEQSIAALMSVLAWPIAFGLIIESLGLIAHTRSLRRGGGEEAASHVRQTTTFGNTWRLRITGLGVVLLAVTSAAVMNVDGLWGMAIWILIGLAVTVTAVIGRALFYVLVIPTTMPGAFFWNNPRFQEHARETGLAEMPQVGVLPDVHHKWE